MHRRRKQSAVLLIILLLLAGAAAFIGVRLYRAAHVDPHAGQVMINDGYNDVWITPLEGVDVNELQKEDFNSDGGKIVYTGEDFETVTGIDVSEHQLQIDWKQVADSGVKFAFIRTGYRGYTKGGLADDARYRYNIENALANGIEVGVYFFSQAVNVAEAIEEANYVLEQVKDYDITLPIMFDWEKLEDIPEARTNDVDPSIISDCGVAFCETIKAAGYDAGIYFNRQLGYYGFDLSRLTDFTFWVTVPGDFPDFYYAGNIWQYSFTETVPGIEGEVDMNIMFIRVKTEESEDTAPK